MVLTTTQMVIAGIAVFLLFGSAIFKRFVKQSVEAKKEVSKAIKELSAEDVSIKQTN